MRGILSETSKYQPALLAMAAVTAIMLAGCSQAGGIGDRPAWGLLGGSKETVAPPPVTEASKYIYRGGRDAVTGRASNSSAPPGTYSSEPLAPLAEPRVHSKYWDESAHGALSIAPAHANRDRQAAAGGGETVTVAPGDTLYAIARRHHVSLTALMAANSLQAPTIHARQQLALPR